MQKVLFENQATESFLTLVQSVNDPEIVANGLSIISATFSNVDMNTKDTNISSDSGQNETKGMPDNSMLLKLLVHHMKSNNLRVICESLNAMFDLYADERHDSVLSENNVINMLEESLSTLVQKIEDDKQNYDEGEIEYFEEVLYNLEHFIKYKRENMN